MAKAAAARKDDDQKSHWLPLTAMLLGGIGAARHIEGPSSRADGKPVTFEQVDPRTIKADPATFQFKSGGDASGVTDRMAGVNKWDQIAAGKAIVWERGDGERFVADGHQRRGLALRAIEAGQKNVALDAYVMKERDGWTSKDVRAYVALKNMKELSGSAVDFAKVVRERPDLIDGSLPMSDGKIKQAMSLSKLSEPAFNMVVSGGVKPEHAAAVGDAVRDPSRHVGMLAEMAKAGMGSEQHARLYVAQALAAPELHETTGSLFGEETNVRSLLAERAKVLDKAMTALRSDKRIFGLLERDAANIEAAGNKLSHETNVARAQGAGQTAALIEKLATTRGPVSAMLDQAARALADGQPASQAARAFVRSVGDTMQSGGIHALMGTTPPPAQEPVDPNQSQMFGAESDMTRKPKAEAGQSSMFGEPTTKDKIAAQSRAQEAKGRTGDPANGGLFGSSAKQTDIVDAVKAHKDVRGITKGTPVPKPPKGSYEVVDKQTGKVVGRASSLKRALDSVNKRDRDHGSSRFMHRKAETGSAVGGKQSNPDGTPLPERPGLRGTQNPNNLSAINQNRASMKKAAPRGMDGLTRAERSGKAAPIVASAGEGASTLEKFRSAYEATLAAQVEANPGKYAYGPDRVPEMARKMTEALAVGGGDTQSPTVKAVAKSLGIKPTVGAIKAALNDQPAPAPRPQKSAIEKAEQAHSKAEAERARAWKQLQSGVIQSPQYVEISKKAEAAKKAVDGVRAAGGVSSKPTGGGGKKALGLLAPVALGAAMLSAANDAKAQGTSQSKAAVTEGAKGAGSMAAFTLGTAGVAAGLMKAGLTAARAVPATQALLMAGGALHGAVAAKPGERLTGAAKGAWDMSLPGMVLNTGIAAKDAVQGRMAVTNGGGSTPPASFTAAAERFQAKAAAAAETSGEKKKGWSNAARIGAYKAREAKRGNPATNLPYGGALTPPAPLK